MGKRINTLNTASSPANDDYLPIDGATNGTRKISADFVNNLITDVEVDGTSVVTSGVAEIDLSGKQDTLTAGSNIQIAQDGTISATDTTYTAGTNVQINNNVISATDTTYTAGTNVQIDNGVISATDTTYSAGTNVDITNGVISATDTTYTAGTGIDITNGVISSNVTPGSTVTITPTLATGTKVADYSINGVSGELYAPSGGGGSTVTVTQKTSTGTNIADITVDGVTTQLYAPSGGGGGSSTLAGLSDVNLTSPTNGQGLVYDATNQIWVNGDVGGGSGDKFVTYTKSVTTTQYGWWVVEDENGNTLDPDTYVIIDISVNVRYYDVLWYQDSAGDYRATLFNINDGDTIRSSSTRTWTITYAKKDFSGGGGSSEANYSTTEHQVGTWIDGSDLYEKTINLTGTYQGDSKIDISSYLIGNENIIESAGYLSYVYSGSTYIQPINGYYANLEYRVNKYQLKLSFGSGSSFSMDAYITIRYTKTGGNS